MGWHCHLALADGDVVEFRFGTTSTSKAKA
jgi:hypothetical protein